MYFDKSTLPLVIGVVGHRDPLPKVIPRLRDDFRTHIEQLIDQFPSTPLLMLNGLAAGMDSEAAEVFLDVIKRTNINSPVSGKHQLIATLPKARERYIDDFSYGDERIRYQSLLSKCDGILDPTNSPGLRGNARLGDDLPSPTCYAMQGVFLVRHALLLFAFYDDIEVEEPGGTSQSVAMKKGKRVKSFLSVDELICPNEDGYLVEYYTPRIKSNKYTATDYSFRARYWKGAIQAKCFDSLLAIPKERLESINQEIYSSDLNENQESWSLPTSLYVYSNNKAIHSKSLHRKQGWIWLSLGFILTIGLSTMPYQLYSLLFLAIILRFNPHPSKNIKETFVKYRSLTEALVIQDFWLKLGIDLDTADLFHHHAELDMNWIKLLLRARRVQLKSKYSNKTPNLNNSIKEAYDWLLNQRIWLKNRIKEHENRDRILKRFIYLSLISGCVFAFLGLIANQTENLVWFTEISIASFLWLLACREIFGYKQTKDRYRRSLEKFDKCLDALNQSINNKQERALVLLRQKAVFEAVGREKFDEMNDWIATQLKSSYTPAR